MNRVVFQWKKSVIIDVDQRCIRTAQCTRASTTAFVGGWCKQHQKDTQPEEHSGHVRDAVVVAVARGGCGHDCNSAHRSAPSPADTPGAFELWGRMQAVGV
jgi:hypothetical protein